MNNKNEKSFSDLFLNSQENNDEITFDSLSVSGDSDDTKSNENVSFNSFSDILNNDKVKNDLFEKEDNLTLEESVSSNIFDLALSDVETVDDSSDNVELNTSVDVDASQKVEKNIEVDSSKKIENDIVFGIENSGDNVRLNSFVEVEEAPEREADIVIDSSNEVEKNNISDIENNEVDVEINSSAEVEKRPEKEENIEEDSLIQLGNNNIFGIGNTDDSVELDTYIKDKEKEEQLKIEENKKIASAVENANIFGIGDYQVENDIGISSIDKSENISKDDSNEKKLIDVTEKKVVEDENKIKLDSPFFGDNNEVVNVNESNPLFSNTISLEEADSTNKKGSGKLDLSNTKHFNVKVVKKKEPLTKFVVGVISYAFFIWLLLIGITLLVYVLDIKIRASKGDYSSPVFNAYVVLTGSMLPEIQVNDVVVTKKVDAKDLNVGDIITFASADSRFSGTIITHRIIKKNPSSDAGGITFQTKGDNNNVADSTLVPESNIYGKVILKIPKLGYLQEFLASRGGWIIVILIPCLTVISYDIVKLAKGLKRKKYNNINVKK